MSSEVRILFILIQDL